MPRTSEFCIQCGEMVVDIIGHTKRLHKDMMLKCSHVDCEQYPNNSYPDKGELDLHHW